jgi:hypothetical protein
MGGDVCDGCIGADHQSSRALPGIPIDRSSTHRLKANLRIVRLYERYHPLSKKQTHPRAVCGDIKDNLGHLGKSARKPIIVPEHQNASSLTIKRQID